MKSAEIWFSDMISQVELISAYLIQATRTINYTFYLHIY